MLMQCYVFCASLVSASLVNSSYRPSFIEAGLRAFDVKPPDSSFTRQKTPVQPPPVRMMYFFTPFGGAPESMSWYIHIYTYIYIYIYIFFVYTYTCIIYIYIYNHNCCICVCIYIYIYIYIIRQQNYVVCCCCCLLCIVLSVDVCVFVIVLV